VSNLIKHAELELGAAGIAGDDGYGGMLYEAILQHVKLFADQGHSGMSAGYTISILEKLLRFEPLTPLTGDDTEWNEVGDGMWQNRRCSHVFKGEDGQAYDVEGIVFVDEDGDAYTSRNSRVDIEFPYTPKREYVKVSNE